MPKTTVDIDPSKLAKARAILGTTTLRETVDEALDRVIASAARERCLVAVSAGILADLRDPEVLRKMWS